MDYKVWFVACETGLGGTDSHEILVLSEDTTERELTNICWQMALENAEMYGIYPPSFEFESDFDEDQDEEDGDENINGYAVPYDSKLHDGYAMGGSFAAEIERQVAML